MKQIALSLAVLAASGAYVLEQPATGTADSLLGGPLPAAASEAMPPQSPLRPTAPSVAPKPKTANLLSKNDSKPAVSPETTSAVDTAEPARLASAAWPVAAPNPPAVQPAAAPATTSVRAPAKAQTDSIVSASIAKSPDPVETVAAQTTPAAVPIVAAEATATPEFAPTPVDFIPIPQPRPPYPDQPVHLVQARTTTAAGTFSDGVYTGPAADAYYGTVQLQAVVQNGRLASLRLLRWPNDRRTSIWINRQALPMLRDEAITAQSANVDMISGATLTSRAFIRSLGGALDKARS